jgi:hypothetical protein
LHRYPGRRRRRPVPAAEPGLAGCRLLPSGVGQRLAGRAGPVPRRAGCRAAPSPAAR